MKSSTQNFSLLCELRCCQKSLIAFYNNCNYYKYYSYLIYIYIYICIFYRFIYFYIQPFNRCLQIPSLIQLHPKSIQQVCSKYPISIHLLSNYFIITIASCISIYLWTYIIQLVNWSTTFQILSNFAILGKLAN